ncbi:MAG: hypothetical protein IPJ81_03800 [Chitinophagaceae bacterium]|nr:hypothetical protein [Chitinophagaceae bacterium]
MFLAISFILFGSNTFSQFTIDPKWNKYYDENPSGIEEHHQATDFIKVIEYTEFTPSNKQFQNSVSLLKKCLLMLSQNALNQMMVDGDYYSRSYKHEDYYYLYNTYYKTLSRETWDRLCPYLISLMMIDGLLKFN